MAPSADHYPVPTHSSAPNKRTTLKDLNVYGDVAVAPSSVVPLEEIPTLAEIKRHIPAHCFRPSLARSIYYVIRDLVFLSSLYYAAYLTHGTSLHIVYLPFFWFFTGFIMWAIFVLGHDCGHGSFSRYRSVNYAFGHFLHSIILVPFHSWRISHRKHHKNTGNYEKDEIFYPMPESEYSGVSQFARAVYKEFYFLGVLAYPVYLIKGYGNAMQNGSHFSLKSELFTKEERPMVFTSVTCWSIMATFLAACGIRYGFLNLFIYYLIPFFTFCGWLVVVTFLHHTEPGTKWYNTKNWNYVRGNLESIDRVYGILEHFHHDIGTHVVHHLFPAIPHYHLREANQAIKPFLGKLHKVETQNPLRQLPESLNAWQSAHVIPDHTDLFIIPKA
ncbi:Omega-3 fatty acid desaturase, endoplasmic reticulum [Gracilariopsis chorda]|uniref:Omega-3 fatty acid desaturase, endoplasmic reticulum n=1 Tax=Gracilariopsis chorda TaxID=448386 RepID=A0A2V3J653_9FLOR|nr:Omega-3 fatty acid desaturase, endoplasmic reticulum [Gracilariopsis chorda]|eukprot:PXF49602.1 Omega-3 fatty acid desaturase, endoplasmic reticulum [Gracilariopsis chorda]